MNRMIELRKIEIEIEIENMREKLSVRCGQEIEKQQYMSNKSSRYKESTDWKRGIV